MLNHSLSHGAISVVSLIGAQMLTDKVENNFPDFYYWVSHFSEWCIDTLNLSMRQSHMESALLVLIMGMIWGIAFWHFSEKPYMVKKQ